MPTLGLGSSMCQCGECQLFFSRTSTFDAHRVGKHEPYERRCLTPTEMLSKGLVERNEVWGWATPEKKLTHWRTADTIADEA